MKTDGQIFVKLNEIGKDEKMSDEAKKAWYEALAWAMG